MRQTDTKYHPKRSDFSQVTFWDTDFDNIDWVRHSDFVIERVFGYGTETEQQHVMDLYGVAALRHFADRYAATPYNRNVGNNLEKAIHHASL